MRTNNPTVHENVSQHAIAQNGVCMCVSMYEFLSLQTNFNLKPILLGATLKYFMKVKAVLESGLQ